MLLVNQLYESAQQDIFIPIISIIILVFLSLLFAKRYNPIHALITLVTLSGIITIGKEVMYTIEIFSFYEALVLINEGTYMFFYYIYWLLSNHVEFSFVTYTTTLVIVFIIFLISQIFSSLLRARAIKKRKNIRTSVNQQYAIGDKNSKNTNSITAQPMSFYHPRFDYYSQLNQNQMDHQQMAQLHIAQQQVNHNQQMQAQQQYMNQSLAAAPMQNPFNVGEPATQKPMNLPINPQTRPSQTPPLSQQAPNFINQSQNFSRQTQPFTDSYQTQYYQSSMQPQQQSQLQVPITQGYIQRQANITPLSQGLNYQTQVQPQAAPSQNLRPRVPQGFRAAAESAQQNPRLMRREYDEYDPKI